MIRLAYSQINNPSFMPLQSIKRFAYNIIGAAKEFLVVHDQKIKYDLEDLNFEVFWCALNLAEE